MMRIELLRDMFLEMDGVRTVLKTKKIAIKCDVDSGLQWHSTIKSMKIEKDNMF